jgi:hypothetical protein
MTKEIVKITSSMAYDLAREGKPDTWGDDRELTITVGKTLVQARFLPYEHVILEFSDGTSMTVVQTSQTGDIDVLMNDNPTTETNDET